MAESGGDSRSHVVAKTGACCAGTKRRGHEKRPACPYMGWASGTFLGQRSTPPPDDDHERARGSPGMPTADEALAYVVDSDPGSRNMSSLGMLAFWVCCLVYGTVGDAPDWLVWPAFIVGIGLWPA